jgi:hypothetical protein
MSQYDELRQENTKLGEDLGNEQRMSTLLLDEWSSGRLAGRTIVIFTDSEAEDIALAEDTQQTLTRAGAATVTVTLLKPEFGIDDPTVHGDLPSILPSVMRGEPNSIVADALLQEWTQTEFVGPPLDRNEPFTGIKPDENKEYTLKDYYPVTEFLLEQGVISIQVDYSNLSALSEQFGDPSKLDLLKQVSEAGLPYAANGIVNIAVQRDEKGVVPDEGGIELTLAFAKAGADQTLPYLLMPTSDSTADKTDASNSGETTGAGAAGETANPDEATTSPEATPDTTTGTPTDTPSQALDPTASYYAVLMQDMDSVSGLIQAAEANGLSCVTSASGTRGHYSVVALLSGARQGIYGSARPQDASYPQIPSDRAGNAAFANAAKANAAFALAAESAATESAEESTTPTE